MTDKVPPISVGDVLSVWMKRGSWWSEITRGATFRVTAVEEDKITIHDGSANGGKIQLQLSPSLVGGRFELMSIGQFKRSLIMHKVIKKTE